MQGKSHIVGGVAAGLVALAFTPLEAGVLLPAVVVGSLLPDIDHPKSYMGRWVKPISKCITHRTITHSLLFNAGVFGLAKVITDNPNIYVGLALGVFSHLLLDACNPTGIPWLYPISKKKHKIMKVRVGSTGETLFMISVVFWTLCLLIGKR